MNNFSNRDIIKAFKEMNQRIDDVWCFVKECCLKTPVNIGNGTGLYKDFFSNKWRFKSIVAGDNISITEQSDTITINGTAQTPTLTYHQIAFGDSSNLITSSPFFIYNENQAIFNLVDDYGGLHILGRNGGEASIALHPDNVGNGQIGQWVIYTAGNNTPSVNDFSIYNSGSTDAFVIKASNNNIGIQTVSPERTLHLSTAGEESIGATLLLENTAAPSDGNKVALDLYTIPYSFVGTDIPNSRILFTDDGAFSASISLQTKDPGNPSNSLIDRLFIDSSGNVGIGTTTPSTKLAIVDGTQNDGKVFTSDTNGNGSWQINPASNLNSTYIGYGNLSNVLTGNSHFTYDTITNTFNIGFPLYNIISWDGGSSLLFGYNNSTQLIDPSVGYNFISIANEFQVNNILNSSLYLDINIPSNYYGFGDLYNSNYGTKIELNDDGVHKNIILTSVNGVIVSNLSGGSTEMVVADSTGLLSKQPFTSGTVTSVGAIAGTGISISGSPITTSGNLTITNTAPDQTVILNNGTGISISGTYPNFTITNTSPSSGGTVTSVSALTLGTSGTDLSSTVANSTTTPVITLNVPTASATNRGVLSNTDWIIFNSKEPAISAGTTSQYWRGDKSWQTLDTSVVPENTNLYFTNSRARSAISLTTTGTSGAATYNNTTGVLNIPQYTDTYTGTVTSVAMTVPTGLTITGSPITTSGTLALSLTTGYVIPTTTEETNWNTAYTNRITSLTTTGSSGAATLSSNTLNIPNYTLSGLGAGTWATVNYPTWATGTPFVKMTAAGTFSLDTNTYLTGNQSIALSGEASGSGATSISVTLSNSAVIGKVLTGYVSGAGTISATDSILQAIQKLNGNIGALVTGVSSVSGTTNRITTSATTGALSVDISASYVGQSSITTLGTIGTGTWNATKIAQSYGGTNIDTSASTGVAQVNAGTWSVSTALANGTTATTQSANDNSTKVATTAYVDSAITSGGANILQIQIFS